MILRNGFFWPDDDDHCWRRLPAEVGDIAVAIPFVTKTDLVVQAGGNVGIWANALSHVFTRVLTFEPDADNYECLVKNVVPTVEHYNAGLGETPSRAAITKWPENSGAHYISPEATDGGIEIITVDSLDLPACDLIILDIEGYEPFALRGAEQTIRRFNPVIMLEEKGLCEKYGLPTDAASSWLGDLGYKVKKKIHRDLVMVKV